MRNKHPKFPTMWKKLPFPKSHRQHLLDANTALSRMSCWADCWTLSSNPNYLHHFSGLIRFRIPKTVPFQCLWLIFDWMVAALWSVDLFILAFLSPDCCWLNAIFRSIFEDIGFIKAKESQVLSSQHWLLSNSHCKSFPYTQGSSNGSQCTRCPMHELNDGTSLHDRCIELILSPISKRHWFLQSDWSRSREG